MPDLLPYNTPVRIVSPGDPYHNTQAWIGGDNWLERLVNPSTPPRYIVDIPTPDDEDIEHREYAIDEVEPVGDDVVRAASIRRRVRWWLQRGCW